MDKTHRYSLQVRWTGNTGVGTKDYRAYDRSHTVIVDNKADIHGSSDAAFRGDKAKHSPEELFVASISACHMLWYLHLCADAGIVVTSYVDKATANMLETANGNGRFTEVILHPNVVITDAAQAYKAMTLHATANEFCFIANSCNFPIHHQPVISVL